MAKRASFYTLGCKLNYTDTARIRTLIKGAGYESVAFGSESDLVVVNTCSVTEQADARCRALVRQIRRQSKRARIVLTGCYAQLQKERLRELEGVTAVVGAADKFELNAYLGVQKTASLSPLPTHLPFVHAHEKVVRTRAFLKVQDGCDYGCTFCTIPLARGKSRSPSVRELLSQANEIAQSGSKEIVLTGINLGDFGTGRGRHKKETLLDLLRALDGEIQTPVRFRLSSIEPNLFSSALVDFLAQSTRFVPHAHIPLQSGSDRILAHMRRRYTTHHYAACVRYLRQQIPDISLGMDVMVGFPTETQMDFETSYQFIQELKPSYLHVFPYSARNNTLAAQMNNKTTANQCATRASRLRALSNELSFQYASKYIGKTREVLFEQRKPSGAILGFTDNYIRVRAPIEASVEGQLCQVKLLSWTPEKYLQSALCTAR